MAQVPISTQRLRRRLFNFMGLGLAAPPNAYFSEDNLRHLSTR